MTFILSDEIARATSAWLAANTVGIPESLLREKPVGQPISETYVTVYIRVESDEVEHEAKVRYLYSPAFAATVERGSGVHTQAAERENAEILSVKIGKTDITDLLTDEQIQAVITDVLEQR